MTTKAKSKAKPKKAPTKKATEYVELRHDLLTTNHTIILHEADFKFNAPHTFRVVKAEPEKSGSHKGQHQVIQDIHFQEGPIKECGVNGIANEDAIAMVLKRLEGFQESEYKCRENAVAITKLEEALMWLRRRTNKRVCRGVEGTSRV